MKLETLHDFQEVLARIYVRNEEFSVEEILVRLDENAGYLSKSIIDDTDSERWLIRSISWLSALCNKLAIDLQRAVLVRFPNCCPYCLEANCICESTGRRPRRALSTAKKQEELQQRFELLNTSIRNGLVPTVDYVAGMLATIYSVNAAKWNLSKFLFAAKLAEERAEIIERYRRLKVAKMGPAREVILEQLQYEIADYLAWLINIWRFAHAMPEYSIQEAIASRYLTGCPYCQSEPCKCLDSTRRGIRSDAEITPASNKYKENPLEEMKAQIALILEEIRKLPAVRDEASQLASVAEKPDPQDILSKLDALNEKLKKADQLGVTATSLGKRITDLISWIGSNVSM